MWDDLAALTDHDVARERQYLTVISDFRLEADENCSLLGHYAASSDNRMSTLRNYLSIPSSGFKNPDFGNDILSRNFGAKLPLVAV